MSTRRDFLRQAGLGTLAWAAGVRPSFAEDEIVVKPNPQQLAWQEAELSMFLHFGMNTFTDREWGEGTESEKLFNPSSLDAGQWAHVAKEAGFKYVILTAKHHDGFCLWPSKYTEHSVKNSPWKGGKGDVVREFTDACHREGLKAGVYLSPWDRNCPKYGDSPAYNEHFKAQLTELLTNYGEIAEVWFDGACGEGPNGKRQEYDWQGFYATIRRHQPNALIAVSGPDVRWVGNEDGFAHETEWSVQEADQTYHKGISGKVWWPAECDVSIRPGWFWHASEDSQVKSLDHLMDIYFRSVGHNSMLLLNVPPNDKGLIAEPDVARLKEFRQVRYRLFAVDLASGRSTHRSPDGMPIEVDLGRPVRFGISMLQEEISEGQRVEEYRIEALTDQGWAEIVKGTTIGHKKLDRFTPVTAGKLRLTILKSRAAPIIRRFGLFRG